MNEVNNGEKKRLETVKKKLLERKVELEDQLKETYMNKETPSYSQDPADFAQSLSLENLQMSLQDSELQEYNMIRQALRMIEQGTYGMCIDCEQPIAEKRLKLYPNATRCLVCQELLEERSGSSY